MFDPLILQLRRYDPVTCIRYMYTNVLLILPVFYPAPIGIHKSLPTRRGTRYSGYRGIEASTFVISERK